MIFFVRSSLNIATLSICVVSAFSKAGFFFVIIFYGIALFVRRPSISNGEKKNVCR